MQTKPWKHEIANYNIQAKVYYGTKTSVEKKTKTNKETKRNLKQSEWFSFHKYHWIHFAFVGSLLLGMELSHTVAKMPSETPLKKTRFSLASQVSIGDSSLVKDKSTCAHPLLSTGVPSDLNLCIPSLWVQMFTLGMTAQAWNPSIPENGTGGPHLWEQCKYTNSILVFRISDLRCTLWKTLPPAQPLVFWLLCAE